MQVGTYIHLVLENAIKHDTIDFEESKKQFLESKDGKNLNEEELFYLDKITKDIKPMVEHIKNQFPQLNTVGFEQEFNIDLKDGFF